MELWIRSQDKLQLLKVEDLEVYDGGNKANNHFFIKCLGNYIGEYATKERALEILDEIQDLLEGKIHEEHINKFDIFNGDERKVYRMPKE